ncbi:MAG TPA: HD domain-containing phosphohydrolase [Gemmatimonadaceae bacterium]|nr:HD domain-containing phosphohydrolase [Gemmatimonadaceae bacterium]
MPVILSGPGVSHGLEFPSPDPRPAPVAHVVLSEVLAAMSRALDLTEGQSVGHTVRTCIIGMRIADELNLSAFDKVALYGALWLKDSGSADASRVTDVLDAGEPPAKPRVSLAMLHERTLSAIRTAGTASGSAIRAGVGTLLRRAERPRLIRPALSRAERGESMALRMGFSTATADAIRCIDEHWDGTGIPDGKIGHEIPLFSRIILLAQTVDAFHTQSGLLRAMRMTRERSNQWFDPTLVRIVRSWREDTGWWESLLSPDAMSMALALEPQQHTRYVDDKGLDEVARAFAEIIDSKSPYTYQHSTNVAKYARATAFELGFEKSEVAVLTRAALLHDVGKLGVPSSILDKAGPMTQLEREEMQRHPIYTWEILQRVGAFAGFARTAALHHEKLDGSGYPWGVKADQLDVPARILCVADMYEALTANRPYRAGLSRDSALKIIRAGSGAQICPLAAEALTEATRHLRVAIAS